MLAASNLDPVMLGNITRKLDEVLDAKNKAIKDLQYELARITKAHNDVISVYNAKVCPCLFTSSLSRTPTIHSIPVPVPVSVPVCLSVSLFLSLPPSNFLSAR